MSENKRITDLESRIAFQEEAIDQLSDVIARQDKEILQMKEFLKQLNSQVKQLDFANEPNNIVDTPPPHY